MEILRHTERCSRLAALSAVTVLLLPVCTGCAQDQSATPEMYAYFYKDELVSLTPSRQLVALAETGDAFRTFVSEQGLERDPLSDHAALRAHNLGLYRRVNLSAEEAVQFDPQAELQRYVETTTAEVQPVFEQGQSLLIPSDEIILGFAEPTTLEQAQAFAERQREAHGFVTVRPHRANTFIFVIDNPTNGRVYLVSQLLAGLDEVKFAEPNHIVLPLGTPRIR